jgi:hypothetical protein
MLAKAIPKLGKGRRESLPLEERVTVRGRDGNGVDLGQVESLCICTP